MINISPEAVIESTVMYGVVHGIWVSIKWFLKWLRDEIRKERKRIIHRHVKDGHKGRLKHCLDSQCVSLRSPQPEPER